MYLPHRLLTHLLAYEMAAATDALLANNGHIDMAAAPTLSNKGTASKQLNIPLLSLILCKQCCNPLPRPPPHICAGSVACYTA